VLPRCRDELKRRFPTKPWVDVLSKADLLEEEFDEADRQQAQHAQQDGVVQQEGASTAQQQSQQHQEVRSAVQFAAVLPGALRVSSTSGAGIDELKGAMLQMLERHDLQQQQLRIGDTGAMAAVVLQHELRGL
jgi:hypothetical protein